MSLFLRFLGSYCDVDHTRKDALSMHLMLLVKGGLVLDLDCVGLLEHGSTEECHDHKPCGAWALGLGSSHDKMAL